MATLSRAQLFAMLDERLDDPSVQEQQDRAIWEACGADRAILVLDLSGFTSTTRSRGILHFLAVFRRAMRIVAPAVEGVGGRLVKAHADNAMATFSTAAACLVAARAILTTAAEENRSLPDDQRVEPCIGLGFGRIIELTDDFFGDEVNITFKLGEDVAGRGGILLTESMHARLETEGERVDTMRGDGELGRVLVAFHRVVA